MYCWLDLQIVIGSGVNTTKGAATGGTGNWGASGAIRPNDGTFSFPQFSGTETAAILQFDSYVDDDGTGTTFGLGHTDPTDGFGLGPSFGTDSAVGGPLHFFLREAYYQPVHPSSATLTYDHWYSVQLRLDFTANGGNGAGSIYYRDLTAVDPDYTAVSDLQNINLNLHYDPDGGGPVEDYFLKWSPAVWDSLFIRADNDGESPGAGPMDNLTISSVPEPQSVAMATGIVLLAGALVRRLRAR